MSMEVNAGNTKSTFELDQYFDGLLNQAVDIVTRNGTTAIIYTFDKTDEVLTVITSGQLGL